MSLKLHVQLTDYSLFRLFNAMLMALQKHLSKMRTRPINAIANSAEPKHHGTRRRKIRKNTDYVIYLKF